MSPFLEGGDKEKVDLPRFLESQTSETMAVRDSPDYKIIPYEKGIREHVVPEGTRVRSILDGKITRVSSAGRTVMKLPSSQPARRASRLSRSSAIWARLRSRRAARSRRARFSEQPGHLPGQKREGRIICSG